MLMTTVGLVLLNCGPSGPDLCEGDEAPMVLIGQGVGGAFVELEDAQEVTLSVAPQGGFGVPVVVQTQGLVAGDDVQSMVVLEPRQGAEILGTFETRAPLQCRSDGAGGNVVGVVVVEGGTDEAYLGIAAQALGRAEDVARLAVEPAGGALPAALQAVVLRAETDLPVLVLLDNDDAGRRAKQTLVSRFGFTNRTEVTTYAEVVPDHPLGTEAEDLFDWRLVERFVEEMGDEAIRGKRVLRADEWHFDLSLAAKSAFVGWVREHAGPEHCARWGALLELLAERIGAVSAGEQHG